MAVKIITVLGARPQFIKAAVMSRAIAERDEVFEVIVHTDQHFDSNMSDVFFDQLNIPKPHYNLEISGLSHGAMTGRMLEQIESLIQKEKPGSVQFYGDTNSTLAGALGASKLRVAVVHVEAGLRSRNLRHARRDQPRANRPYVNPIVVLPMHPQLTIKLNQQSDRSLLQDVTLLDPLPYLEMQRIEISSKCILTDSGGIQKEAYFYRAPCVTLRNDTEWPETVHTGWSTLVGSNYSEIIRSANTSPPANSNEALFGNGRASEKNRQHPIS